MAPAWLDWARRLSALAQTGLEFAESPYDFERYTAIRTITAVGRTTVVPPCDVAFSAHGGNRDEPGEDGWSHLQLGDEPRVVRERLTIGRAGGQPMETRGIAAEFNAISRCRKLRG